MLQGEPHAAEEPPAQGAAVQVELKTVQDEPLERVAKSFAAESQPLSCTPVSVAWKDLAYAVKVKDVVDGKKTMVTKSILHKTDGFLPAKHMLAIMGPSGSGKTSLCDVIAHRVAKDKIQGQVLFNGKKLSGKERKQIVSYVAQEDTLMGQFTVLETVSFAARFHYGYGLKKEDFDRIVLDSIQSMGLTDAKDTLVGDLFRKGLSGGQKRRLSIAIELISKPSVIVLDEPTSGLDSSSAYGVVKKLQDLCNTGHTVVMTIHQPSSEVWALFDQFMLLSKGHTAYVGSASVALDYFASQGYHCPTFSNPADYLISLVNTDFVELNEHAEPAVLAEHYRTSAQHHQIVEMIKHEESSPSELQVSIVNVKRFAAWVDFVTLSKRFLLNNVRNPGIYWVRFAMYTMLSLMIGLMYLDLGNSYDVSDINSRVSVLFFVGAFLVFMSVAVLPFFIMERATFLREYLNGAYGLLPYMASNFLCSLPGLFIISLASAICVVLISGMNGFWVYLACLFLSLVVAEAVMSLIASLVPHYIVGIALGAGLFGFFMLCEGFFIVYDDIPDYFIWGYYIAFHSYSFRVFMYNEFEPINNFTNSALKDGNAVLEFYSMEDVVIWQDLLVLLAWAFFYQLCFGLVLKFVWGKGRR